MGQRLELLIGIIDPQPEVAGGLRQSTNFDKVTSRFRQHEIVECDVVAVKKSPIAERDRCGLHRWSGQHRPVRSNQADRSIARQAAIIFSSLCIGITPITGKG